MRCDTVKGKMFTQIVRQKCLPAFTTVEETVATDCPKCSARRKAEEKEKRFKKKEQQAGEREEVKEKIAERLGKGQTVSGSH